MNFRAPGLEALSGNLWLENVGEKSVHFFNLEEDKVERSRARHECKYVQ